MLIADGSNWAFVDGKETGNNRSRREALEMEKESSSVVATVQVEMAETMEIV